jgi:hypothetical protein
MTLKYNGHGEGIPGVPARDLSDTDITRIAGDFLLSPDETIALLTSRGLYSVVKDSKAKRQSKPDEIPEPLEEETNDGS